MPFTWTNTVPVVGNTINTPLALEIRSKLDTLRDSLCTTHYTSHLVGNNSSAFASNLNTNNTHRVTHNVTHLNAVHSTNWGHNSHHGYNSGHWTSNLSNQAGDCVGLNSSAQSQWAVF